MGGWEMPSWNDMGFDVDMREDGMTISKEGLRIEMT